MEGLVLSYSCLLIQISWKVESESRIEPPIHTEYLSSGGAVILIFIVLSAMVVVSFCIWSAMSGYIVGSGATSQHCGCTQVLVDVQFTLHYGAEHDLMDATELHG